MKTMIFSLFLTIFCAILLGMYVTYKIDYSAGLVAGEIILGSWVVLFFMQIMGLDKDIN